jgi:hypothetical protein
MYQKPNFEQLEIEEFHLPFEGKLKKKNRWIVLSKLIPWGEFESEYASKFSKKDGRYSFSFRVALGSLIIKEKLKLSDVETVETISENPYLQYFLGFKEFQLKPPFDSSLMTHFRKRISSKMLSEINERIVQTHLLMTKKEKKTETKDDDHNDDNNNDNGTLIIDSSRCSLSH